MAPVATSSAHGSDGRANNNVTATAHSQSSNAAQRTHAQGMRFDTLAIHKGSEPNPETGAIIPDISLATAYRKDEPGLGVAGLDYSRLANPNRSALESNLATLENAKYACAFGSGTAAISAITDLVPPSGHILAVNDVYGGTYTTLTRMVKKRNGIRASFVDLSEDGLRQRLESAITPETKLVWVETPTNPTMRLVDIALVSRTVKSIDPSIFVVVDSTFATPWYQNPLDLGADIVAHSCTKYINGHSDVLLGAAITNIDEVAAELRDTQIYLGAVPSPFECWLTLRGLKTIAVRMREHGRNALRLAKYLEAHPLIKDVAYPGLPSHPSFNIVKSQMAPRALQAQRDEGVDTDTGIQFSGMLSFRLNCDPADPAPTAQFLKELKVATLAVSLGGVESLAEQPSTMTHSMLPEETRLQLGIGHNLIRFSVGLEDIRDLEGDLDQALRKALAGNILSSKLRSPTLKADKVSAPAPLPTKEAPSTSTPAAKAGAPTPQPPLPRYDPPQRLAQTPEFVRPRKRIVSPAALAKFQRSSAFTEIMGLMVALNDCVKGKKLTESVEESPVVQAISAMLGKVSALVDATPAVENAASRFGNPAFRDLYRKIKADGRQLHESIPGLKQEQQGSTSSVDSIDEVSVYLEESWGNEERIDYGSGMELNFLCWLLCLVKLGLLDVSRDGAAVVLRVFWQYIQVMRKIQSTYWLEPAGSHGVWGLDDYHFLPFVWGSGQLSTHRHLRPKSIHDKEITEEFAKDYMYLSCIQFINSIKTASLRWHSPMLDDISSVKTWSKVNEGMMKMYKAEVLSKLPIAQHIFFGSLLAYPPTAEGEVDESEEAADQDACGHGHAHAHGAAAEGQAAGWGDCCGIPIPSAFAAAQEEKDKVKNASGVAVGGAIKRVPFD